MDMFGSDVGENRGRNDIAFGFSSQNCAGSFGDALLNLLRERVGLGFVHERADVGFWIARIANLQTRHSLHIFFEKLIVDRAMHQDSIGGHADLSLMREAAEDCGVERQFEIGILQNDQRAVSAQLEDCFFQAAARPLRRFCGLLLPIR